MILLGVASVEEVFYLRARLVPMGVPGSQVMELRQYQILGHILGRYPLTQAFYMVPPMCPEMVIDDTSGRFPKYGLATSPININKGQQNSQHRHLLSIILMAQLTQKGSQWDFQIFCYVNPQILTIIRSINNHYNLYVLL